MSQSRAPFTRHPRWRVGLVLAATILAGGLSLAATELAAPSPLVSSTTASVHGRAGAVSRIGIVVSDLDRAIDFYTSVLAFEKVSETEVSGDALEHLTGVFAARCRVARLRLGHEEIELTQYLAPEGRPIPVDSKSNDRWFQHIAIVVSDMDRAYAHLRAHKIRHASSAPQTLPSWNPNAGGISAFYFKDPDGHVLEVIHFPKGKGDPRWQNTDNRLFLGIDHTALVVSDTEQSLKFYRDTLGLRVAGESENYGTEQEHLNAVFGARLRITGLRAAEGPGVELLEYLAPSDGRETPTDQRSNDLAAWTTHFTFDPPDAMKAMPGSAGVSWVSSGFVWVPTPQGGVQAGTLLDPDRHRVVLVQAPSSAAEATSAERNH